MFIHNEFFIILLIMLIWLKIFLLHCWVSQLKCSWLWTSISSLHFFQKILPKCLNIQRSLWRTVPNKIHVFFFKSLVFSWFLKRTCVFSRITSSPLRFIRLKLLNDRSVDTSLMAWDGFFDFFLNATVLQQIASVFYHFKLLTMIILLFVLRRFIVLFLFELLSLGKVLLWVIVALFVLWNWIVNCILL